MDKEQARFILQSFRPDGADAQDPDFAEALAMAAEDRELGEWLAAERAQDAAFAAALNNVEIPEELRENILGVLRGEGSDESYSEMDAAFIGALAAVQPPQGLRDQIVSAMKVEERAPRSVEELATARSAPRRVQKWLQLSAVAAAVMLGVFLAIQFTPSSDPGPKVAQISVNKMEHVSIAEVASVTPDQLTQVSTLAEVKPFLADHGLPAISAADLPAGLIDLTPVGCKIMEVGEDKKAALVCFNKAGQMVHLVVIDRENLEDPDIATLAEQKAGDGNCWQCAHTKFSVATWRDKKDARAFFLLSKEKPKTLREGFF